MKYLLVLFLLVSSNLFADSDPIVQVKDKSYLKKIDRGGTVPYGP